MRGGEYYGKEKNKKSKVKKINKEKRWKEKKKINTKIKNDPTSEGSFLISAVFL